MYQAGYGLFVFLLVVKYNLKVFTPFTKESSPLLIIKEDGTYGLMRFTKREPEPINKKTISQSSTLNLGYPISLNIRVSYELVGAQLSINNIDKPLIKWQTKRLLWFGCSWLP